MDIGPRGDKQRLWDEMAAKIDRTVDRLGHPIDPGIKETVIALNLLGFKTAASCEGHADRALPFPWVDIELAKSPRSQELREIDIKYLPLAEEYDRSPSKAKENELRKLNDLRKALAPEVDAFESDQRRPILVLLREFHEERKPSYECTLTLAKSHGRIESLNGWDERYSPPERKSTYLATQQSEMRAFTEFLKKKFFNEQ